LQNETYVGKHYYNKGEAVMPKTRKDEDQKYRKIVKTGRRIRPRDEWLMVEVEPIVEPELFERVQDRLKLNRQFSERNNKVNSYLLTGLIYCPCGKTRTGEGGRGYTYYRCTDRLSKFPEQRECFQHGVNGQVLDVVVWDELERMLTNPELMQQQAERWINASNGNGGKEIAQEANKGLEKLTIEEERYAKAYGAGIMSEDIYRERMSSVIVRRKSLLNEIEDANAASNDSPQVDSKTLAEGVTQLLGNLPLDEKKVVVRKLVTKITATKEKVIICGHIPLKTDSKVGLRADDRNRRTAQCRQVDPV
jgi:site-specific DNA recombinase